MAHSRKQYTAREYESRKNEHRTQDVKAMRCQRQRLLCSASQRPLTSRLGRFHRWINEGQVRLSSQGEQPTDLCQNMLVARTMGRPCRLEFADSTQGGGFVIGSKSEQHQWDSICNGWSSYLWQVQALPSFSQCQLEGKVDYLPPLAPYCKHD